MGSSQIVIPSEIPRSSKSQNESSGLCRYGSKIRGRRETQESKQLKRIVKQYKYYDSKEDTESHYAEKG